MCGRTAFRLTLRMHWQQTYQWAAKKAQVIDLHEVEGKAMQLGTSKGGVAGAMGPFSKVVANKLVLAAITIALAAIVLSAALCPPAPQDTSTLKIKQDLVNVPFWSILGILDITFKYWLERLSPSIWVMFN